MSDTYVAGKNKKKGKNTQNFLIFFRLLEVFLSFKGKGDPKKSKKKVFLIIFYFYLIAITVIIALKTNNII
jgi:hypothetical protein